MIKKLVEAEKEKVYWLTLPQRDQKWGLLHNQLSLSRLILDEDETFLR